MPLSPFQSGESRLLILASRSPRRRELLAEAGYQFCVLPPDEDVECGVCSKTGPADLVSTLAYRKAAAIIRRLTSEPTLPPEVTKWLDANTPISRDAPSPLILAADTVAECNGFILGKPRDEAHAHAILSQLNGRVHRVLTGVCLWPLRFQLPGVSRREEAPLVRVAVSRLQMDEFSDDELDDYLASGQWRGKAGAFGYQDRLDWVHLVEGSPSNVVGLPLELLTEMIEVIRSCE